MDDAKLETSQPGRRRLSVEDSMTELIQRIHYTMDRLSQLWDEVHMEKEVRESRVECAYLHFYTLLDDIVKSEENMVSGVKSDIEARRLAIADLQALLKIPGTKKSKHPENSIALLKSLDREMHQLQKQRDDAVEAQMEELETLKSLCRRLGRAELPVDASKVKQTILSPTELKEMKAERMKLLALINERTEYLLSVQDKCRKMYKSLKELSTFNAEQQNLLNTDFSAPFAHLDDETVGNMEKLHTFMIDAYKSWAEQAAFQYSEMLLAFCDAAEKCGVEDANFMYPESFNPDVHNQSIIDKLEAETNRMRERYQRAGRVFDAYAHWRELWQEKLVHEQEASNPQFYKNRGGQLNTFLKRQKQLNLLLPQAMDKLRSETQNFLEQGGDAADVLVDEMLPDEYADFLLKEHNEQKEVQKMMKITANSTRLGRRVSGRVKVAGSKLARRKMSIGSRHRLSIISPVRAPVCGPKTSSPKYIQSPLTTKGASRYVSGTSGTRSRMPTTPSALTTASRCFAEERCAAPSPTLTTITSVTGTSTSTMPRGLTSTNFRAQQRIPISTRLAQMKKNTSKSHASGLNCVGTSTPIASRLPLRALNPEFRQATMTPSSVAASTKTPTTSGRHWRY